MAKQQTTFTIPKINLIPKDPFYDTLLGKIMVWSIQVGRYIIVFTEIIVIMSFASRFKLDRDLTDLTAQISQKKSIVASFGDVEARTRRIQDQVSTVQKIVTDKNAVYYLDKLSLRIPTGIALTQLAYEGELVSFSGKADTSGTLASLIASLQQEQSFSSVSVERINSGDANDPTVQFSMRINLPGSANAKDQPVQAPTGSDPEL
jgi:Tfp pilus assembly protein PilN